MGLGLMVDAEAPAYRAVDVCRLAPCTYRQLDYWCRAGVFGERQRGLGSGSRRAFTGDDVKVARALARLSAAGLLNGSTDGRSSTIARFADTIRSAVQVGVELVEIPLAGQVFVSVGTVADDLSEP